jgi:uncharacterized protein (TIGR00369 family)
VTFPVLTTFHCFGCTPGHPRGLHLQIEDAGPDAVRAKLTLGTDFEGLRGVVHGGIVAALFDEAMAWALYRHRRAVFVTATMDQRYRAPVPSGQQLVVTARIEDEHGDRITATATVARAEQPGRALAVGTGTFVPAPERVLAMLTGEQRAELDRVFAAFAD